MDEAPPGIPSILARAAVLLFIFLPVLLMAPIAALVPPFRRTIWYAMVKNALAAAGTAFIKWGQWAACRPDMFPERLCAQLAELHSKAPVHSFAHTRTEVERALGKPLGEIFDTFDAVPLASGSIAQVHRASLAGRAIAVKVRHPAVVRRIVTDFTLMRWLAEASARLPLTSWLNLKASVGQFSETMVAQTRLDIEGEHLARFNWNFGTSSWRDCAFPKVVCPNGKVRSCTCTVCTCMWRLHLHVEIAPALCASACACACALCAPACGEGPAPRACVHMSVRARTAARP